MSKHALFLCAVFAAAACNSPAAPTPQKASTAPTAAPETPSGPPAATLAVERAKLFRVSATALAPSVHVAETSGQSDARVTDLAFNLADGGSWTHARVWAGNWTVHAGGVAYISDLGIYGDPDGWTFEVPAGYTGRVSVVVSYLDSQGRKGTVSAMATVPG